ncbi:hypothetical protein O3M35_005256 [Rhynocoris fuscipes]|uniref:Uncharacterized protein n=1 Tax=Rhynocoris fuscipes TaxID=488301 RepID=A0AAW1DIH0_9HEMI
MSFAKSLFKIRGQLLYLNCNVSRAVEVHFCTMCNDREIEDMYHYIGVCSALKEFRGRQHCQNRNLLII